MSPFPLSPYARIAFGNSEPNTSHDFHPRTQNMPTRHPHDEWDDDEESHDIPEGVYDDQELATEECPYCHEAIVADAILCPYCDHYLSDEDAPSAAKPWWIVLGIIVCLASVLGWMLH